MYKINVRINIQTLFIAISNLSPGYFSFTNGYLLPLAYPVRYNPANLNFIPSNKKLINMNIISGVKKTETETYLEAWHLEKECQVKFGEEKLKLSQAK